MMDSFTHNQYTFYRRVGCWLSNSAWHQAEMYRELAALAGEGIAPDAMHVISLESDRRGGFRYYRLQIDCSTDEQVTALAGRLHQAWLEQKTINDARYSQQREEALANQASWGEVDWEQF